MIVITIINIVFVMKYQIFFIKKQPVLPKFKVVLEQMGKNIKFVRKRRKLTTVQVAERAGTLC